MEFCICKREAKYQLKNGRWCCESNISKCPEIKMKISLAHKQGRCKSDHLKGFGGKNKNKISFTKEEVFCKKEKYYTTETLKRYLFLYNLKENKCEICGIENWNEKPITLECHHKNGKDKDNELENLQLLCPNCHSQTENYRGKNKNKGVKIISDELMLKTLKSEKNIRQALIKLGVAPMGSNYDRAKRLLKTI